MKKLDRLSDKQIGKLGSLLNNRNSGCGASPDAGELWNWIHGECDPVRAKEIRTHLAADEELYELWQSFRCEIAKQYSENSTFQEERAVASSAMHPMQDKPDSRNTSSLDFFSWLSGWPAGAIAYAAVVTLLFTALRPHSVPAPEQHLLWQQWRVPKSTSAKLSDQSYRTEVQPFLVGVRTALIAIGAEPVDPENRTLPAEYPACKARDAECLQLRAQLQSLGELSVDTVFKCVTGNAAVAVPETLFDVQVSVMSSQALSPLHAPLRDWVKTEANERERVCAAASTLLNRALSVMDSGA